MGEHRLYQDQGRAGALYRQTTLEMLGYIARRIPEIADSPVEIDKAMRWRYDWEIGPFEIWDALGFETVLADMKAANIQLPAWVEKMSLAGAKGFYNQTDKTVYVPQKAYTKIKTPTDEISLAAVKSDPKRTI